MSNKSLEVALKIAAQTSGKQQISAMVDELENIATTSKDGGKEAAKLAQELDSLAQQQALINNFQKSTLSLEKQELATVAAAQALEKIQKEAQDTNKPFVELARNLDAAEKDFEQMRKELSQQAKHHKGLQKQLDKTGISTKNLTAKKRELARDFTKVGKKVDTYTQKLKQGTAAERKHGQSLDGLAGKIIGLTAAYVGLNQVSTAIKDIFTTGDKFERLVIQMDALMGSIEGGDDATKWVKEFTTKTPLQLDQVSQAFVKLKAFGLDPMSGTMQSITDQAFKLGGGFEEVEGISLAVGQAWAKQKLQGEEILQLIERGVPVWDLLEKATGRNAVELQKMSSAGELGRDVIKALIDEMGKGSVGAAEANMALLSGQISNAKDNIDQFYNLISESGAMDWLKGQLTAINEKFAEMTKDGSLKEWAQTISDTIVSTGEAIKKTFTTLYEYKDEIANIAKVWLALKVGNYFGNVVSGAKLAVTALASYRASIVATTGATNTAALAAGKWKKAISFAGKTALYTYLITQLVEVGFLYKDLLVLEQKAAKSKELMATQANKLTEKLKEVSEETKHNFTNLTEFNEAVKNGTIFWDDALKRYTSAKAIQESLAQATKLAAEETRLANEYEAERPKAMKLTLEQSIQTTAQLEKQALSMDGVRGGVQGFINAIDAAKTTLQGAGEQYSQQVVLLDQLREKYVTHNESLERQAYLAGDVAKAYEVLGVTSGEALTELADKQRGAFELIQQSQKPIEDQEKAFLAWAKSALDAADATGEIAPKSLEAAAAALGLTDELEKLVASAKKLKPVNDTNSDAFNRLKAEVDKTTEAIAQNTKIVESSTASAHDKKIAQELLIIQQARLKEETDDLNKVQQLEIANLGTLQREQKSLEREMLALNKQYERGNITSQEYNDKKQRMADMLGVVNNLLGDFKNAQDQATQSTERSTKAIKDSTQAVKETVTERKTLIKTYEEEVVAAGKAKQAQAYNDRQSNIANAQTIIDFEEKNNIPEHLRSQRADAIALRRENERNQQSQMYGSYFEKTLAKAKDNNTTLAELDAIYKKTTSLLGGLGGQYGEQLRAAIEANKAARKSQSTEAQTQTQNNSQSDYSSSQSDFSSKQPNYPANPQYNTDNSGLTQKLEELINILKNQSANKVTAPGKAIRLELVLDGEVFRAQLMDEFEERFVAKLEQGSSVGSVGFGG